MTYAVELYVDNDFHLLLVEAADESSAHQLAQEWAAQTYGEDDGASEQEVVAVYRTKLPSAAQPVVHVN